MITLFDSEHCSSRCLCHRCRLRSPRGEAFRRSLLTTFSDLTTLDFACPHGLPWDAPRQTPAAPAKKLTFPQAVKEIQDMPAPRGDDWRWLLASFQRHLSLHEHRGPCWAVARCRRFAAQFQAREHPA